MSTYYDCVVVGSGHAGCSAALAAMEAGCTSVLIVEKAPREWVGGNGYFTAGAHRTVHGGLQDLLPIVHNVTPEQAIKIDMDPYTVEDFTKDIMRLGKDKPDAKLVKTMVESSREAVEWLARKVEIPFILSFHRQAYEVNGRQKFWGGMALSTEDGGKGLISAHMKALEKAGVEIWFDSPAIKLTVEKGITGKELNLSASSVVLAAGGYESSSELRAKHLGSEWEKAHVRGTPFNTGDGLAIAQAIGAKLVGDWAGCHSTCWDANAPADAGDRELSNQFTKSGYPLGIMVNINGQQITTYAKFGRQILLQPEGCAFQVWGADMVPLLRKEEYGDGIVEKIFAGSIEELADKLLEKGLKDKEGFLKTVRNYNAAVQNHRAEHPTLGWDPTVKDGLSTQSTTASLQLPKSNWAVPIDQGPFLAVKVACGITFTFGGLAIDPDTAGVLSKETGAPIKGLFCTGEMVGGLFHNNYPGGSGLTAGAVFGRKAGREAAKLAGKLAK
ncbi:uncharacterized protein EDB91DRAFT_1236183 [Suillus paluster]|uniref:uncharacterized protein n=1 Tax=Suillus paluster TaxID=48578 RepID=UPI001B86B151|nr:uncharacterized protein EDB91DRAFT_1236183 [Suillus paluster]KAG1745850.1 hypothetical protein EDB91DRAFT_1236183 [Suillus paluster]